MNPERSLLLVGATDETVAKAKQLGLHVLLLQHPTKVTAEQERLADHLEVVDYTRWDLVEPIASRLHDSPASPPPPRSPNPAWRTPPASTTC